MATLFRPGKSAVSVKPKLQNSQPPEFPSSPPKIGPFCIRATCTLQDSESQDTLAELMGYDTNYDIVKKTQLTCQRSAKPGQTCSDPYITMVPTQKIRSCDGHVVYHNRVNNEMSIMFPKL